MMDDYTDRSRLYRLSVEFYLTDEEYDRIARDPSKFLKFINNQIKQGNPKLEEV